MARTIAAIKESMTTDFMRNPDVAHTYGFETGAAFSSHFSSVSIENLLFYIVASAVWVLENLFDQHRSDVEEQIDSILPHRPKWYRDKVLDFMKDKTLLADTDRYDTTGMTEDEIEACRVVKYAAAVESADASILTIKVAGETDGVRSPLDAATETQLLAYIGEVKDAGVRVNLVNRTADVFHCEVEVYYDAMLLPESVEAECRESIRRYIENLPFNGEYTHMALVDELQQIDGVRIVEMVGATTAADGENPEEIHARFTPQAGYFSVGNVVMQMKSYK